MSKQLRVPSRWLAGWLVGASLLGACAGPEDTVPASDAQVGAPDTAEAGSISVSLSVPKAALSAREDVLISVTLRNDGRAAARLLKWHTPAEDVEEALFDVTVDGQAVAFEGPHYKRPAPGAGDYLTLAPGESLTRTVSLSAFYDMSRTGNYRVRYAAELHGGQAAAFRSNDVELWVEGRESALREAAAPGGTVTQAAVSYTKCDATQQSTALQALNAASAMANNSATYLNGTPSGTPRYTTWFGAFSSTGWNTAKTHFAAIKDAIDTKPITIDCGCKKTYYAYVYPAQPYKIYVCKAFWSAPMTGTDSKGGTLIHELSHFNAVAGTDDHVYGQSGAKSLASSSPAQALDNADNHEYFAENTPFLQ
ncbi:M35 family metallo-endopeptidase [Pyxidicoccus sp. 3LFB2]